MPYMVFKYKEKEQLNVRSTLIISQIPVNSIDM